MNNNTELIAMLRLGASISRERKLNQGFDAVADEAAKQLEAQAKENQILAAEREAYASAMNRMSAELAVAQVECNSAQENVSDLRVEVARQHAELAAIKAQEPVAVCSDYRYGADDERRSAFKWLISEFPPDGTKLYVAPAAASQ